MTSTEVVQHEPVEAVVKRLQTSEFLEQVKAALPGPMAPERFVRVTVTALRDNPDLAEVDRSSLFSAVVRCATDGLLPDGREAAFWPVNDKKKGRVALYVPMIGGMRKIAGEFGWSLQTRVVYENDTFEHELGLEETIKHTPTRPGLERGPLVAAYAIARHRDHQPVIEVLSKDEIEKVRATSRAKDYGPWKDWYERMAEKTAGRRLFAKLPLGDRERVESVLAADELAPGEAAAQLYGGPPGSPATDAPADREANGDQQGAGEVVDEAEQVSASSDTDGTPAPASAAEPEPIEEAEWKVPDGVDAENHPDVIAANEAAEVAFTSGKFSGKNLREVADDPKGPDYLSWVLKNWKTERFRAQVLDYCKVYLPELYEQATAEEEGPPV